MTRDLLTDYRVSLDLIVEQVDGLTVADLDHPTPCSRWPIGKLAAHVLGAMRYYARLARDGAADVREEVVRVGPGDDVAALVAVDARDALGAWSVPGALDRRVTMSIGPKTGAQALAIHVADLTVHAWDLAAARHRSIEIPPELAEACIATWAGVDRLHGMRGTVLAEPVPVPAGASPTDRLVAFCGRHPRRERAG